jgi:hypothetical protein
MLHLLVWVISPEVRSPIYTLNRIGHSGPLEAAGFGVETEVPSNMEANGRFDHLSLRLYRLWHLILPKGNPSQLEQFRCAKY